MSEPAAVYRETRERFGEFALDLDDDWARAAAPACPGWSVQDVVSHVVGIVADLQAGRLDGIGTDEWTRAQVESRRSRSLIDVVVEWNTIAPAFEEQVAGWPPEIAAQLVADAAMHEIDVRGAVGDTGARDTEGVRIAFAHYSLGLGARIVAAGLPALALDVGDESVTVGDGEPGAHVATSRFELARAMSGRRSPAQVRGYAWVGDPEPYLAVFSGYGTRERPLVD